MKTYTVACDLCAAPQDDDGPELNKLTLKDGRSGKTRTIDVCAICEASKTLRDVIEVVQRSVPVHGRPPAVRAGA